MCDADREREKERRERERMNRKLCSEVSQETTAESIEQPNSQTRQYYFGSLCEKRKATFAGGLSDVACTQLWSDNTSYQLM